MVEPFSTGLHSVLNHFPAHDDTVIIIGAGTIGLCVLAALRSLGSKADVLVLARHDFQARAVEKLGAASVITGGEYHTFNEVAHYLGAQIKKPMMGKPVMVGGAQHVFECIGSKSSISNALAMTRAGGKVVLVGMPSIIQLDWTPISVKELTVSSSWAYHHAEQIDGKKQTTFEIALDLLENGKVDLSWMLTDIYPLEKYKNAFAALSHRGKNQVIKAAFVFN